MNVLLLEDDLDYAAAFASVIETAPGRRASVVHERSVAGGLERLGRESFDVIVVDYHLGAESGMTFIRTCRLRRLDTPILMLTGEGDELVAVEALEAGASDYLPKGRATAELIRSRLERLVEVADTRRQQRAAEAALRERDERLRLIAQVASDTFWIYHIATDTIDVGEGFARLGYRETRIERGLEWWLAHVHPDDRERCSLSFGRLVAGDVGERWAEEYRLRRADRTYAFVVGHGYLVRDPATGKPAKVVGALVDVTRSRLLEEQLGHAQKLEVVGRLASGVAHDFNNVLTAILGASEVLLASVEPGSPAARQAELVRDAAVRGAELTSPLLAFGRKEPAAPAVLAVNDLVRGIQEILRRVVGARVQIVCDLDPGAGTIKADRGSLEQAILNLGANARDAMPAGGKLTLETRAIPATPTSPALVRLAVSDTGAGMEPHVLARLFEPFFTTKPPGRGTGLGLASVHATVKQLGGDVRVTSAPREGTRVELLLPAVAGASPGARSEPATRGISAPGGSETVLVVEDEGLVRTLVRDVLSGAGYNVLAAADPDSAERAASSASRLDLLLSDVVLPAGGGREVARRVLAARPKARVLFMSGCPQDDTVVRGLGGHAPLLAKPFSPSALLSGVRAALDVPVGG